jgi:putative heme-binding domain-containing protein
VREEVLAVILSNNETIEPLLAAMEREEIPASAVDALRRRQLTQHKDAAVRARAEKLFGSVSGDRAKVYDEYKAVADLPGQSAPGCEVFRKHCASCHRLDREGFAVGPDLFGIRNQPKAAILLHILAPDHEITPGFAAYTALTSDGRTFTGLLAAETPTTITLRLPQGQEESLLRADLEELVASKLSLMPQGLEKNIARQELADLLSYLKGEE